MKNNLKESWVDSQEAHQMARFHVRPIFVAVKNDVS
jgi:hypothetical protein